VKLRVPGKGWLALLGGGEFSFGQTEEVDRAWLARTPPGPVGFIPAASGSDDYPRHFGTYLHEVFAREVEVIPIYRARDGRRGRNSERIRDVAAVYLGGGVTDHLLAAVRETPAEQALAHKLGAEGGVVVAIAAAAQCAGAFARSIVKGDLIQGLGWLPRAVVEPNFDPAHDRRLRKMLAADVEVGLGIPAGSAVLLGPAGVVETIGTVFRIVGANGDIEVVQ
jgi:cyanophycinase-like exopeptidase